MTYSKEENKEDVIEDTPLPSNHAQSRAKTKVWLATRCTHPRNKGIRGTSIFISSLIYLCVRDFNILCVCGRYCCLVTGLGQSK